MGPESQHAPGSEVSVSPFWVITDTFTPVSSLHTLSDCWEASICAREGTTKWS